MLHLDPNELQTPELHGYLLGAIGPRPICFASTVDEEGKVVSRDESFTEILISKGVKEANFISAIVSLGEGRYFLCLGCFNFEQFQMRFAHMM